MKFGGLISISDCYNWFCLVWLGANSASNTGTWNAPSSGWLLIQMNSEPEEKRNGKPSVRPWAITIGSRRAPGVGAGALIHLGTRGQWHINLARAATVPRPPFFLFSLSLSSSKGRTGKKRGDMR